MNSKYWSFLSLFRASDVIMRSPPQKGWAIWMFFFPKFYININFLPIDVKQKPWQHLDRLVSIKVPGSSRQKDPVTSRPQLLALPAGRMVHKPLAETTLLASGLILSITGLVRLRRNERQAVVNFFSKLDSGELARRWLRTSSVTRGDSARHS